jgi:hypothetical protein
LQLPHHHDDQQVALRRRRDIGIIGNKRARLLVVLWCDDAGALDMLQPGIPGQKAGLLHKAAEQAWLLHDMAQAVSDFSNTSTILFLK